ncbi:MAG: hypothetical protein NT062_33735 [Proteobacteria bacterium]|nr:hypothetical protein [Pseudomonadota bacterium]
MRRTVIVLAALVACGGGSSPSPPIPAPTIAADARKASSALEARATRFEALAKLLADPTPLVAGRDALSALHDPELEPKRVDQAIARAALLAASFTRAAVVIRTPASTATQIADAIDALGNEITRAFIESLGTLSSDLVGQVVIVRDRVCAAPARKEACVHAPAVGVAFDFAAKLASRIREELDGAAGDAERTFADTLDVHAATALRRATGRGPSGGEPCGAESLCRWDHRCMPPMNTCEHECFVGAMQPCPAAMSCVTVAGLPDTYCRATK